MANPAITKTDAIKRINNELGSQLLNERNTLWSNVVRYGSDDGWWFTISLFAFKQDMHLLLNDERAKVCRHLKIKASEILSPATKFRCKDQVADVFMLVAKPKKLADVLDGGTKHNFSKYVVAEYRF